MKISRRLNFPYGPTKDGERSIQACADGSSRDESASFSANRPESHSWNWRPYSVKWVGDRGRHEEGVSESWGRSIKCSTWTEYPRWNTFDVKVGHVRERKVDFQKLKLNGLCAQAIKFVHEMAAAHSSQVVGMHVRAYNISKEIKRRVRQIKKLKKEERLIVLREWIKAPKKQAIKGFASNDDLLQKTYGIVGLETEGDENGMV